jgi:hypothetical protein
MRGGQSVRFARGWYEVGLGPYRPDRVCDDDTYGQLPRLPEHLFTGDFQWLTAEAAGPEAFYMEPNPVTSHDLDTLNLRLARDGLVLPAAFATFMSNDVLQGSVPSFSADEWAVSRRPVASPIEEHARLLQFMNNQQGYGWWYLYLGSDGSSPVIGSDELLEPTDDDGPDDRFVAIFMERMTWLAPSFEEFVYRYWIENVAWFQIHEQKRPWQDLSPSVRTYLDHYRTPQRGTLDVWPTPIPPEAIREMPVDDPAQGRLW